MNKVILIGNLTRDPELRVTPTGRSVCSSSLAVQRTFANQAGERVTDFFNIIVWGKTGENCSKYLSKGRKACVVGELQTRSYEAKDGTKRTVTEIVANEVEFLSPRGDDGVSRSRDTFRPEQPPVLDAPDGFTDFDDDSALPF